MNSARDRQPEAGGLSVRGTALVVEQDSDDLRAYSSVLRRLGFEVRTCTNYHDALRSLEEAAPDFVFVNEGGPEFEARDLVQRALAHDRHTPVVVLAKTVNMACYLEAMQLGAVDYVEKPLTAAKIEYLVTTHVPLARIARARGASI